MYYVYNARGFMYNVVHVLCITQEVTVDMHNARGFKNVPHKVGESESGLALSLCI
jgi:hypothetical protein